MKIIFQSYNTCCQNKSGGVNIRIHQIAEKLKESGIEVEFFNPFITDLRTGDILHVFRLDYENFHLIQEAKKLGLKVVVSTIMNLTNGFKIDFYRYFSKLPIPTTYKIMEQTIELADSVITETFEEKRFLINHYKKNNSDVVVIPNGIEEGGELDGGMEKIFQDKFSYILQVGRFDKNKNQKKLIRAMKGTGINVVFVGEAGIGSEDYYKSCMELASGDKYFHFMGWLEHSSEELNILYTDAQLLVLPSYYETFGLVVLEAGRRGTEAVMSRGLPIMEFDVFKDCISFDPRNTKEMRDKIITAFHRRPNVKYKELILNTFAWKKILNEHINLYKTLLENIK